MLTQEIKEVCSNYKSLITKIWWKVEVMYQKLKYCKISNHTKNDVGNYPTYNSNSFAGDLVLL